MRDWSLDRKMVVSGIAAANGMSMSIPLQSLFSVANLIGSHQRNALNNNSSPYQQQSLSSSTSYPLVFLGLRFIGCTDLSGQHKIRKVRVELVSSSLLLDENTNSNNLVPNKNEIEFR